MYLEVWGSDFGLPSVDYKCLQMMTLAKFSNLDIVFIKKNVNPLLKTKLPSFTHEFGTISNYESFANFLISKNLKIRNNNSLMNVRALKKLFEDSLEPALKYLFWIHELNYDQVTRKTFAKLSKFPFNYFAPSYLKNEAKNYFEILYPNSFDEKFFETKLVENAKSCIKLLSDKLKENNYFEETPGEVDALIFGYLAIILKFKFPYCDQLRRFTSEQDNLVKYTDRILNEYFQIKQEAKPSKNVVENFEVASWKDIIFTGMFSASLMLLFSIYIGLIEVVLSEDIDEISKEENEDKTEQDNLKKYEMPMPNLDIPPNMFSNLGKS